jgi:NAD(P)-dependent dehydrogenase (short-subunit alcohol dehydrogenase family)
MRTDAPSLTAHDSWHQGLSTGTRSMVAGVARAVFETARCTIRDAVVRPDPASRIGPHTVVVITGASAGVGRATAQAFARRGARIGLIARGEAGLEGARADVESLGGQALVVSADVSDCDAVDAAATTIEAAFGRIDVWVNVAMASVFSPFAEMEMADFRHVTEVTYLGYVWGTHAALKRMRPRNHGRIIQVGSALAYRGIPLQSAYCGAKHAIQGFTESVRTELIHDRSDIWITMVQLPAVNTPQFNWVKSALPNQAQPVPPIFQPEVPAAAILWAAEHHRRELNVGSSTDLAVYADKVAPGVLDHYLGDTGFASQQTHQPEAPDRANNLYQPVDQRQDAGAHGRFDARASERSGQLWLATHRNVVAVTLGGLAAIALGVRSVAGVSRRGSRAT